MTISIPPLRNIFSGYIIFFLFSCLLHVAPSLQLSVPEVFSPYDHVLEDRWIVIMKSSTCISQMKEMMTDIVENGGCIQSVINNEGASSDYGDILYVQINKIKMERISEKYRDLIYFSECEFVCNARRHAGASSPTLKNHASPLGFAGMFEPSAKPEKVASWKNRFTNTQCKRQMYPSYNLDRIDQKYLPLDHKYSYTLDGSGVHVYVFDGGVSTTHEEFENRADTCFSVFDKPTSREAKLHGTHVAGVIGSKSYGVAKNVYIHSIEILDLDGDGRSFNLLKSIIWLEKNRKLPAVAHLSLGSARSHLVNFCMDRLMASGMTVVTAAGNDYLDACNGSPSSNLDVISVGSVDSMDHLSPYSNWGHCVTIYAPGEKILSLNAMGDSSLGYDSGTSMAAPHVTGVVAQILQMYPDLSHSEVKAILLNIATPKSVLEPTRTAPLLRVYDPYRPACEESRNYAQLESDVQSTYYVYGNIWLFSWLFFFVIFEHLQ
ncbi:extracellular serine proteinase-like [Schistocerca gregaria]|uniref:extracellular serine proteinase-like n=1 Tax=Schistocerca gregaria TaxID=7010 RepID=UPI00211E9C13|nr:extracellular serine proteinase-like [Schistocerca gregaria]